MAALIRARGGDGESVAGVEGDGARGDEGHACCAGVEADGPTEAPFLRTSKSVCAVAAVPVWSMLPASAAPADTATDPLPRPSPPS